MCRAAVSNLRRLRAVVSNPTSASAAAVSSPGRRRTQLHLQRSGEALATRRIYFAAGLFDAAFRLGHRRCRCGIEPLRVVIMPQHDRQAASVGVALAYSVQDGQSDRGHRSPLAGRR
jgi:hypothetical protein